MVVLSPADYHEARAMARALPHYPQPTYIRLTKGETPLLFTENMKFKIGPAKLMRTGFDGVILTTGAMLHEALAATRLLENELSIAVIHFPTIKPLDKAMVWEAAQKFKKVVTIEEHQLAGGFGASIAEVLSEHLPTPILRLGVDDQFGESGSREELLKKHGLDAQSIARAVKAFIES
jgi:transketolase